ncbi:MAG: GNAT family N-acetyltransferase [Burkholderiales bacterium]|nr:GNAT family N-acetyltransferase [Burkholderiales bacterium]
MVCRFASVCGLRRSVTRNVEVESTRVKICQVNTPEQVAAARALYNEYAEWIGMDLSFQGFAEELATLPGAYTPPDGRLLLAETDNEVAGCVALRPLERHVCEMKRLYVRPRFRGCGVGKLLVEHILKEARAIGYMIMRLDTLSFMADAVRLYEAAGFTRCTAYYETPISGTVFMELRL